MKFKVGIIDYGFGNLSSIKNSLLKLGFKAKLSSNHFELRDSDILLLPGVGAFKPAMKILKDRGLDDLIYDLVKENKPIIGICLGMQLLGRSSVEEQFTEGLNLIPEDVYPFEGNSCHIGWNKTSLVSKKNIIRISETDYYFNHSFAFSPNLKYSVCETCFEEQTFTSVIKKDKIVGLQFHPEKSQNYGLNLLKNLIQDLCTDD